MGYLAKTWDELRGGGYSNLWAGKPRDCDARRPDPVNAPSSQDAQLSSVRMQLASTDMPCPCASAG